MSGAPSVRQRGRCSLAAVPRVTVVSDTTGYLPRDAVEAHGIRLVSLYVNFDGGERTVIDGPFTEAKELIAGYWIWECASRDEAIEWLKRAPFDGGTEIELRQIFEAEDFGDELTPELREAEERAIAMLSRHRGELDRLTALLLEHETVDGETVYELVDRPTPKGNIEVVVPTPAGAKVHSSSTVDVGRPSGAVGPATSR
ncbi:MAG: hypothetical protein KY450_12125 [Actinobacteria bacterium]|nr:hypothetical protein [Actinomycetota bacterium]